MALLCQFRIQSMFFPLHSSLCQGRSIGWWVFSLQLPNASPCADLPYTLFTCRFQMLSGDPCYYFNHLRKPPTDPWAAKTPTATKVATIKGTAILWILSYLSPATTKHVHYCPVLSDPRCNLKKVGGVLAPNSVSIGVMLGVCYKGVTVHSLPHAYAHTKIYILFACFLSYHILSLATRRSPSSTPCTC